MGLLRTDNLKDLSTEDLDQLRAEIRALRRGVSAELISRQRSCAYCGQRIGDCLQGHKYCSAWHRYLDAHRDGAPLSRVQFECQRALHRLRVLRRPKAEGTPGSEESPAGPPVMPKALRNIRIRQILREFRAITGEALRSSLRSLRKNSTSGA